MTSNTVLIAGATGQIGRAVARHFARQLEWNAIGLSRRPDAGGPIPIIQVELTDTADCRHKLAGLREVTHVVYAARYNHVGGQPESAEINAAMLANVLDAVEEAGAPLRHVHLVHGTKYYGHTRSPMREPFREDAPRGNFENFYFSQQDFLEDRLRGSGCSFSISRPHTFCDLDAHESRSITLAVAVYAALLREQGLPLVYPGSRESHAARTQFTWLPLLAEAIFWMCTTPACANQAFNIVNDDPVRWDVLWPRIAAHLGMQVGEPQARSLVGWMADKDALWQQVVHRCGLRANSLGKIAQWPYADYVFGVQWDVISDMGKARAIGFTAKIDTPRMWRESLDFLAAHKVVPSMSC